MMMMMMIIPCWQEAPCLRWTGAARSLLTLYIRPPLLIYNWMYIPTFYIRLPLQLNVQLYMMVHPNFIHSHAHLICSFTSIECTMFHSSRSCNLQSPFTPMECNMIIDFMHSSNSCFHLPKLHTFCLFFLSAIFIRSNWMYISTEQWKILRFLPKEFARPSASGHLAGASKSVTYGQVDRTRSREHPF